MMIVFFERENELDFVLSRQMNQLAGQYADRVAHRLELIVELEKLNDNILSYHCVNLMRDVNDVDRSKARDIMTAISQTQTKVLKKISFVVQMWGKTSCFVKWLDLAYFDHEPHMIDYMLQKQCYVNDSHYDMHLIYYVNGRGLHFGHHEFSLITGLHFREKLNPTVDLRPTFAEYLTEWWTCHNDFLKNYISRTPKQRPDILEAYLLKVVSRGQRKKYARIMTTSIPTVLRRKISMLKDHVITDMNSRIFKLEAIIQFETYTSHVLVRERNSGVVEKLEFNEDFCNLSTEFCDELNKEFTNCLSLLVVVVDQAVQIWILMKMLMRMKLEEEEMLLFQEEKKMEKDNRLRLEEEARLMREEEKLLENAMARMVPKKRSHCTGVTSSTWLKVSSKFKDKSQGHCVINQDMPEFLKNVKPWVESEVDKVFIPLNEPGEQWFLAKFDIRSGLVTIYDSGDTYAIECREWYIRTMDYLENEVMLRLPVKSLLHFRIVSKTWKSIIDNTEFVVSYGARPSQPASFIVTYDQGFLAANYTLFFRCSFLFHPVSTLCP
ncbi:phospholipase-like protein [Tanacetum coccineum]